MTNEELNAKLEEFCELLIEHVDSVRVMVTTHEGGQTCCDSYGAGNWYAQKASVEEWLQRGIQKDQAQFIAESVQTDDGDDGDEEAWKE